MLPLFVWAVVGIIFHSLLIFAKSVADNVTFSFKKEAIIIGVYIAAALIFSYMGSSANLAGWFLKALFCAGGFLLPFVTSKLITIKP